MDYPRIVFMGTPEIAEFILTGLLDNGYPIVGVIAQEDKPVGRKKIIEPVPTKKAALARKIPVFQPHRIRLDYEFVRELKPDLIITCAYGQIIPQELIDIPALGCINVHGSLLPKYRGASPIQQALIHNDRLTGVTILEMTAKMDAGKMLYQKEIAVDDDENYTSLYQKIAVLGLQALLEMLPDYIAGKIQGEEQDESRVTLCKKISKEEEHLSVGFSCEEFVGYVRGLSYSPGGYLLYGNEVFKILRAKKANSRVQGEPGQIVSMDKDGILLQLKDGQVSLTEVQRQGKKRMKAAEFVNGNRQMIGARLA